MAKRYTGFSTLSDGSLIYRSTGRSAPSSYQIKGNRVYNAEGRMIGYLGKPKTAKERQAYIRASQRKGTKTGFKSNVRPLRIQDTIVFRRAMKGQAYQQMDLEQRIRSGQFRSVYEVMADNYARKLVGMVNADVMTPTVAEQRFQDYLRMNKQERAKAWEELQEDLAEYGYPPSD